MNSLFKKLKNTENIYLYIVIFLSITIFLIDAISLNFLNSCDAHIVNTLNLYSHNHYVKFAKLVTLMGSVKVITYLIPFIVLLLLFLKKRTEIIFLLISTYFGGLLTTILKHIFKRPRPDVEFPITHVSGFSFPSGHSTIAACFYGFILYLLWINLKNSKLKILAASFIVFLIILVGFSRVYLGAHCIADVIAGISIGIFWLAISILMYKKINITLKHQ